MRLRCSLEIKHELGYPTPGECSTNVFQSALLSKKIKKKKKKIKKIRNVCLMYVFVSRFDCLSCHVMCCVVLCPSHSSPTLSWLRGLCVSMNPRLAPRTAERPKFCRS